MPSSGAVNVYWYAPFNNAGEMNLAAALARQDGVRLTVQSVRARFGMPLPTNGHGDFELVRDLPGPVGEAGESRTIVKRAWVAVERAVRRERFVNRAHIDVIHLHTYNPFTDWAALRRLKKRGGLLVQSIHNVRPHRQLASHSLETLIFSLGYEIPDLLVVAHDTLKCQLVSQFSVPAAKIAIVDLPATMEMAPPRPGLTLGNHPVHFLFFGTFRENKGMSTLIRAVDQLPRGERCRWKVTFAGRGEADLEGLVRALAARDARVEAEIGFVSDARRSELYRQADCILLPYQDFHAQSGVLQDAYCNGLPVIASDVGALGAAVRHDRTGWLIAPGDVDGLEKAMLDVVTNSAARDEAGRRGRDIAQTRQPENVALELRRLYDAHLRVR